MSEAEEIKPYDLEYEFEALLVAAACQVPNFWGRIAHAVQVEAFPTAACRDALAAVRDIAKETGRGPDSASTVVQRLRRWQHEGALDRKRLLSVLEVLDDADDNGFNPASYEAYLNEFVPQLKDREIQAATFELIEESGKTPEQADIGKVLRRIQGAERLGERDISTGFKLGVPSLDRIKSLSMIQRLPTGIDDVDHKLEGGMGHGLGVFVAGTGVGKSMFLCHLAAHALMNTMHVVYATLELGTEDIEARIVSNLTGLPINALMTGQQTTLAAQRLQAMEPFFGALHTRYFTPRATTVTDIIQWTEECEQEAGVPVDLVIVDMASRLKGYTEVTKKSSSTYKEQGDIFTDFRNWLKATHKWGWTGDQPQRGAKDKKKIDTDDVSDSMAKARECDLMITAVMNEDETMIEYFVAKNRHALGRQSAGPLPHDFALGRMVPISRRIGNQVW